jgi:hypothetical protein
MPKHLTTLFITGILLCASPVTAVSAVGQPGPSADGAVAGSGQAQTNACSALANLPPPAQHVLRLLGCVGTLEICNVIDGGIVAQYDQDGNPLLDYGLHPNYRPTNVFYVTSNGMATEISALPYAPADVQCVAAGEYPMGATVSIVEGFEGRTTIAGTGYAISDVSADSPAQLVEHNKIAGRASVKIGQGTNRVKFTNEWLAVTNSTNSGTHTVGGYVQDGRYGIAAVSATSNDGNLIVAIDPFVDGSKTGINFSYTPIVLGQSSLFTLSVTSKTGAQATLLSGSAF